MRRIRPGRTLVGSILATAMLLTLAGCGAQQSSVAELAAAEASHSALPSAERNVAQEEADSTGSTPADAAPSGVETEGLAKTCGTSRIAIQCESGSEDCSRTVMYLQDDAAHVGKQIAAPEELRDYTAVGLGCAAGADGKSYFVVQFGELPYGCEFCEWFHMYDTRGQLLTHSIPPIIEDAELPGASDQMPNNREYETLLKKLGLAHPEVSYFEQSAAK